MTARYLDLSTNRLNDLTSQIGLVITLKELHLSFNNLTELPAELGRYVAIDICPVVSCAHAFLRCVNLEKINVSNNKLESLPAELGRCVKLRHIDVTSNKITLIPPGMLRYGPRECCAINLAVRVILVY